MGWIELAGAVECTNYYYFGDHNNFSFETFEGFRTELNISGDALISPDAGIMTTYDRFGSVLIGISSSLGLGYSPTVFTGNYSVPSA